MKKKLTLGSCFSGIGGFEKGAEMAGIKPLWSIENNPFCQSILKKNFKKIKVYGDIREIENLPTVDIVCGGFPCQDISVNGKGEGIKGEKSSLWGEMYRICCILRPPFIVIENSPALTSRGLCTILSDLAKIGYDAEWQCLSNYTFGFPHERERIYLVAYRNSVGTQSMVQKHKIFRPLFQLPKKTGQDNALFVAQWVKQYAENRVFGNNDGIPNYVDRVTAIGNTVNPIIAEWIFNLIKEFNK